VAFDTATRNALQRMVAAARDLLVKEFVAQCQGVYGIQPGGAMQPLETLAHLAEDERARAALLRERVRHLAAGIAGKKKDEEAVGRMVREQAFTVLNRLSALRMCEERGLIQHAVRDGYESRGFKLFDQEAKKSGGTTYERYRLYLELVFDEVAVDLGVLFDRHTLQGLLFPRENALEAVLETINATELAHIWAEDEAIGWIYQYFNSEEERRKMRKESSAPRSSRELAVRNQFFTPRYVVEFLTDNTLGRTWYEMRAGRTALAEHCRYMLRRPTEVFLAEDEVAPDEPEPAAELSPEERLKHPVHVRYRARKDPRDLKILDPASGSGHFLLYAFDLLETVYREAWEDEAMPPSEATGKTLRADYPEREALDAAMPELILRHNLYGIDIDPRTAQIAALSLWLRAQRAWHDLGLKPADPRRRVTRSNIVCAEPMPGEADLLESFTLKLKPRVLGQLVETAFEKMRLAGEAGSLLKIDRELASAIEQARRQWRESAQAELDLDIRDAGRGYDVKGITGEVFWEHVEQRILDALARYAEEAEAGTGVGARMFADDAARGFAFIDLCRQPFDVVLMNPPFGAASDSCSSYLEQNYPCSKVDLFAAFVERALDWVRDNGRVGAITSRTGLFLSSYRQWREEFLLTRTSLVAVADLGEAVMDDANVSAAAYCLEKHYD